MITNLRRSEWNVLTWLRDNASNPWAGHMKPSNYPMSRLRKRGFVETFNHGNVYGLWRITDAGLAALKQHPGFGPNGVL